MGIFVVCLVVFIAVIYLWGKGSQKAQKRPAQRSSTPTKERTVPVTVRVTVDGEDKSSPMDDINRELLQEAIAAGKQEDVLYYQRKLDKTFQNVYMDYLNGSVRLDEMKTDQRVTPAEFEKACNEQIKATLIYRDMYEKYYNAPLNTDVFKTYAMFLEKQGRYLDAAKVCARALDLGFPNDRTQGGMAGRLVRMVKKAGGETTNEIEDALQRFCQ